MGREQGRRFLDIQYQGIKQAENIDFLKFSALYKQIAGIEPVSPAWEASVLPMNYICVNTIIAYNEKIYKYFF